MGEWASHTLPGILSVGGLDCMIYALAAQTFRSSSSLRASVFMALFKVGPRSHIYCVAELSLFAVYCLWRVLR